MGYTGMIPAFDSLKPIMLGYGAGGAADGEEPKA